MVAFTVRSAETTAVLVSVKQVTQAVEYSRSNYTLHNSSLSARREMAFVCSLSDAVLTRNIFVCLALQTRCKLRKTTICFVMSVCLSLTNKLTKCSLINQWNSFQKGNIFSFKSFARSGDQNIIATDC
jgi:hypothetical protein